MYNYNSGTINFIFYNIIQLPYKIYTFEIKKNS